MREDRLGRAALSTLRAIAGGISFADFCLADRVHSATGGTAEKSEAPGSAVGMFCPDALELKQFCDA
jgi:hypothetical protein